MIYIIRRIAKVIVGLIYSFSKISLVKLIKNYNSKSKNVIWVYFFGYQYPIECMIRDMICIKYLLENEMDFKIVFGKKIGKVASSNIFINPSKLHDVYSFKNHCSIISAVIKELEMQGNKCYPSFHDLQYWENKTFMHQSFDHLEIPTPKTSIIYELDNFNDLKIEYPLLLKDTNAHHSKGLYKVNSKEEAIEKFKWAVKDKPGIIFLAQELIPMRKDLRVIHVGNEIILHYWRVNPEKEWKPTSTSYGSNVDFITFPEKWRPFIQEQFNKLDMITGAWDITWRNDDLESEPIFLEISPLYAPNPPFSIEGKPYNYGQWKEKLLLKDAYEYHYYDITDKITKMKMDIFFNKK